MDVLKPEKALHDAILNAFPSRAALEKCLSFQLDVNLNVISEGNLDDTAFRLIRWAAANGCILELVDALRKCNPKNPVLANIPPQLLHTITARVQVETIGNRVTRQEREPFIGLINTSLPIVGRDEEANALLALLRDEGPAVISIIAPPGFGKSALLARTVRLAMASLNTPAVGLQGVAVLDARIEMPTRAALVTLLGRLTGRPQIRARFDDSAEGEARTTLFFDVLRQTGSVWLVIENAERVLLPEVSPEFRLLVKGWCEFAHTAKLIVLSRQALNPAPACHRRLAGVERALRQGLAEEHAATVLRDRLRDSRFGKTENSLLLKIARRLHCVPLALVQFAGYLLTRETEIDLNEAFIASNDILRLFDPEQMEESIERLTVEHLRGLDPSSRQLVGVAAWARCNIPRDGLLAVVRDEGAKHLTRVVASGLLQQIGGTTGPDVSFAMHPLIQEFVEPVIPGETTATTWVEKAYSEYENGRIQSSDALSELAEREFRRLVDDENRDDLAFYFAASLGTRGLALHMRGRVHEAAAAFDEAIRGTRRSFGMEKPENLVALAVTLANRGRALQQLGRLRDAMAAHDEAIEILRRLVENDGLHEFSSEMAKAVEGRGVVLEMLGRVGEAIADYKRAIIIHQRFGDNESGGAVAEDLANVLANLGVALHSGGRLNEAMTAYDEAITIRQRLINLEGRSELVNGLATVVTSRGIALGALHRLNDAVAAFDEAITSRRRLIETEGHPELADDLAFTLANRGVALDALGRGDEALESYDEAIRILRRLVDSEGRGELTNQIASSVRHRGNALRTLGRMDEALVACDEAIGILRNLIEREGRGELSNELAAALVDRGATLQQIGRVNDAVSAHAEAIAIRRLLVENQGREDIANDLAKALFELGEAFRTLGRMNEAVEAYDETITIRRRLVEIDGRSQVLDGLASALFRRASLLSELGSFDARRALDEALQVWRRLVREKGSDGP